MWILGLLTFLLLLFCSIYTLKFIEAYRMNMYGNLMERLRQWVGSKGWDYCIFWKFTERFRFNRLSDQKDDEDDKPKNFAAEKKRREKLTKRLYALRSLIPVTSKLDKASILEDAIEYVKELQKQVKKLTNELKEHSDSDGADPSSEHGKGSNVCSIGGNTISDSNQNQDLEIAYDKTREMEVQVEVTEIDGNHFHVKVISEKKPGGFVRLLETMESLGLEVTDANVYIFKYLISNDLKVKKKDSEMVEADHVRESLLELIRNGPKISSNKASDNNNGSSSVTSTTTI